jgi:tight adherence protein B
MIRVAILTALGAAAVIVARLARTAAVRGRLRELRGEPRRLPASVRAPIADALDRAALDTTPETVAQVWAIATAAVAMGATAIVAPLAPVLVAAAALVPVGLMRTARSRGDRRAEVALPEAVRSIAADLRSGGTVRSAIDRLGENQSPLRPDFRRIAARLRLGESLSNALEPWPQERPIAGARAFAGALVVTAELGGAAARPLDGLASSFADRLAIAAETRAQSAQARVSAIVVGVAPLGYLALSAAIDRDAIGSLLARPVGRACLAVGIALDVLAVVWMRRIVRDRDAAW